MRTLSPAINVGDVFGRLTVTSSPTSRPRRGVSYACLCICGTPRLVGRKELLNGKSTSCGCFQRENARALQKARFSHGHNKNGKRTPTCNSWHNLIQRCLNPSNPDYHKYGARGITVCERWLKFENFLEDMGERPLGKNSIERKNNDLGYSPDNCVWGTPQDQSRNTRLTVWIEFRGERRTRAEWCELTGIPSDVIRYRLKSGYTVEEAFTIPVDRQWARTIRSHLRQAEA